MKLENWTLIGLFIAGGLTLFWAGYAFREPIDNTVFNTKYAKVVKIADTYRNLLDNSLSNLSICVVELNKAKRSRGL